MGGWRVEGGGGWEAVDMNSKSRPPQKKTGIWNLSSMTFSFIMRFM